MDRWYKNIIEKIKMGLESAVFVIDKDNLLSSSELMNKLKEDYEIYNYSSEIMLRIKLKKTDKKLIVIIREKQVIPSDFEQNFQIVEIDFGDIFQNLRKQDLENIEIQKLDKIYELYMNLGCFVTPEEFKKIKESLNGGTIHIKEEIIDSNFKLKTLLEEIEKESHEQNIDFSKLSKLLGEYCFYSKGEKIYVDKNLDLKFIDYIKKNFNKLAFNRDFDTSQLNSNIIRKLVKNSDESEKKAIICFDCMSFTEWLVIKNYLVKNIGEKIIIEEKYSYSFVPSITKYSRQAIFTGKMPIENKSSNEEKGFKEFFIENLSIKKEEIFFKRTGEINEESFSDYKIVGIICSFIDELAHGTMNKEMLIKNIEIYLKNSKLKEIIENLLINDYEVYFCSDHGNIQCEGNGVVLSKWLVQEKGTRAAIYKNVRLAEEVKFEGKEIFHFPSMIEGYIVSDINRKNFRTTDSGISHGGITIEEMIVPFIKVGKK